MLDWPKCMTSVHTVMYSMVSISNETRGGWGVVWVVQQAATVVSSQQSCLNHTK